MFNFELPEKEMSELFDTLESLADDFEDEFLKPTLKEAAEPVKTKMKSNIEEAANKGYATGESARSVGATLKRKKGEIVSIAIYPRGYDKGNKENTAGNGLRNMDKVCYIEFGTSKQNAHPVMQPAFQQSIPEIQSIFVKNLKEYAKKKGVK